MIVSLEPPPVNHARRTALPALGVLLARLAWHRYASLPPHERPAVPELLLSPSEMRQLTRLREASR